ncbi:MAG: ATP-binding cassette domain-containing protein [Pseudomonadota bacterium]
METHPLHREICHAHHLLLKAEGLAFGHGGHALGQALDLEIHCGDFLAVVGRNGAGKTTLFRTLLGLQPAIAGRISTSAGTIAYVPQRVAFDELFPVSVQDVVAMGTLALRPGDAAARRARVASAIEELQLTPLARHTFRSLSEGQRQRVLLARVLASGAKLVFLDEPTAAMDAVAEREAMDLLGHLQARHGMALVVVNHHLEVALRLASRVLFLDPDAPDTVLGPPAEVLTHPSFRARYGDVAFEVSHG